MCSAVQRFLSYVYTVIFLLGYFTVNGTKRIQFQGKAQYDCS